MNMRNIFDDTTRLVRFSGVVAALLVSTSAWGEGDAGRGWARAQMCAGCHGIGDYRTAYPDVYSVPKLGGQQAAYLLKSLQDYKSGARKHPTMNGIAATLSDQDMADLAAYYDTKADATRTDATTTGVASRDAANKEPK